MTTAWKWKSFCIQGHDILGTGQLLRRGGGATTNRMGGGGGATYNFIPSKKGAERALSMQKSDTTRFEVYSFKTRVIRFSRTEGVAHKFLKRGACERFYPV